MHDADDALVEREQARAMLEYEELAPSELPPLDLTTEGGFLMPSVDIVRGVDLEDRYRHGGPKEHVIFEKLAKLRRLGFRR